MQHFSLLTNFPAKPNCRPRLGAGTSRPCRGCDYRGAKSVRGHKSRRIDMIGTAQSVQGRSRASHGWFAALALGVALAFGAGAAMAGDLAKKQDGVSGKAL